jgi:hypothetical protein
MNMDCEHCYGPDGIRSWQPDSRPMPGGGAYRVKFARIYRCPRCLHVVAEIMTGDSDSYREASRPSYGATPPTHAELDAIKRAS